MSAVHLANGIENMVPAGVAGTETTVAGAAVPLTMPATKSRYVILSVKQNAIHLTLDGTDPVSAAAGAYYAMGHYLRRWEFAAAVRAIEAAGGSAAAVRLEAVGA